jgi:DNA invertase Pin-like site-specific DNA recombinase
VRAGWGPEIICFELDRLGRNTLDLLNLAKERQARSADTRRVADGFRLNTPYGEFALTILGAVAKVGPENIGERSRAGLAVAKPKGRVVGGSPNGGCKAHVLEKLPTVLRLKRQGYSVLRVARHLTVNRKGVDRVLKLRAEGKVRGRAEALAEVPIERRGKK